MVWGLAIDYNNTKTCFDIVLVLFYCVAFPTFIGRHEGHVAHTNLLQLKGCLHVKLEHEHKLHACFSFTCWHCLEDGAYM